MRSMVEGRSRACLADEDSAPRLPGWRCGPFSPAQREPPVPLYHPAGGPPPPMGEDRLRPQPVVSRQIGQRTAGKGWEAVMQFTGERDPIYAIQR